MNPPPVNPPAACPFLVRAVVSDGGSHHEASAYGPSRMPAGAIALHALPSTTLREALSSVQMLVPAARPSASCARFSVALVYPNARGTFVVKQLARLLLAAPPAGGGGDGEAARTLSELGVQAGDILDIALS